MLIHPTGMQQKSCLRPPRGPLSAVLRPQVRHGPAGQSQQQPPVPPSAATNNGAPLFTEAVQQQAAGGTDHAPQLAEQKSGGQLKVEAAAVPLLTDEESNSSSSRFSSHSNSAQQLQLRSPGQPADGDLARFKLHKSVQLWSSQYNIPSALAVGSSGPVGPGDAGGRIAAEVAKHLASGNPQALLYWSYHMGRHLFFLSQGVAGMLAHRVVGTASSTINVQDAGNEVGGRLAEVMANFLQDWEAIQEGCYKLPWDMTTPAHPDKNPLGLVARSAAFLQEAVSILDSLAREQPQAEVWLESPLYPAYYKYSYHYQLDGWFSSRSADLYDFTTEVVFLGSQDAMQRTTLLPLAAYFTGQDVSRLKLLEIAAGTGRFHTFIKDNWPGLRTTVADLSPFYLEQARANMQSWKRLRASGRDLGGRDGTGTSYLQCAAESLPVGDGSQDVVVCVYFIHELPPDAREVVAKEMFRVLKPGGLAVMTDSVQLGDRPAWDHDLGKFGQLAEPHFASYIACDLGELFEGAGFTCDTKYLRSSSKTLSFFKPAAAGTADALEPTAA